MELAEENTFKMAQVYFQGTGRKGEFEIKKEENHQQHNIFALRTNYPYIHI